MARFYLWPFTNFWTDSNPANDGPILDVETIAVGDAVGSRDVCYTLQTFDSSSTECEVVEVTPGVFKNVCTGGPGGFGGGASIQRSAPAAPAVKIVKNTVGANGTFAFTVTGATPTAPSITTTANTGTQMLGGFDLLPP